MATYTAGTQCSGASFSNNVTIVPIQNAQPIKAPAPFPWTTFSSFSFTSQSLPNNPLRSYLLKQLKRTGGKPFEVYLKRFFEYLGYPVSLTKSTHDQGADLIVTLGWKKIVIQAKQWKQHVGTSAIQEAHTAKDAYKADHAIVICTSEFTEEAKKLASTVGVECWDGNRLCDELYTHGYFFPPEWGPHQPPWM
jgi:hypothetical protein